VKDKIMKHTEYMLYTEKHKTSGKMSRHHFLLWQTEIQRGASTPYFYSL